MTSMAPIPMNLFCLVTCPKPYKFMGFGDTHGPKPYRFIRLGDVHCPKPYRFIRSGDIDGVKLYRLYVTYMAPNLIDL